MLGPRTREIRLRHKKSTKSKSKFILHVISVYVYLLVLVKWQTSWLVVGWFGLSGPLRQYFSLYRVSPRERGRKRKERIEESKMSKQFPPTPSESALGPCPTIIQIVGRPGTGSLPRTNAPSDHPWQTSTWFLNVRLETLGAWDLPHAVGPQTSP